MHKRGHTTWYGSARSFACFGLAPWWFGDARFFASCEKAARLVVAPALRAPLLPSHAPHRPRRGASLAN